MKTVKKSEVTEVKVNTEPQVLPEPKQSAPVTPPISEPQVHMIRQEVLQAVGSYLMSRPFGEVENLIAALRQCPLITKEKK
jgi:hypothetical protein